MGRGLEVEGTDGTLRILQEGERCKFVADCEMVCFSGRRAVQQGQDVLYITERAVFRLEADGLVLAEVAPGIDVGTDVLAHIAFPIRVAEDLATMDARLYREELVGPSLDR